MSFSFRHFNHDHSPLQIISTKLLVELRNKVPPLPPTKSTKNIQKQHLFWYELIGFLSNSFDYLTCHVVAALTLRRSPTNLLSAQDTICYHPRCTTSLGPNPSPVPEKNGSIQRTAAWKEQKIEHGWQFGNIEDRLKDNRIFVQIGRAHV